MGLIHCLTEFSPLNVQCLATSTSWKKATHLVSGSAYKPRVLKVSGCLSFVFAPFKVITILAITAIHSLIPLFIQKFVGKHELKTQNYLDCSEQETKKKVSACKQLTFKGGEELDNKQESHIEL